MRMIYSLSIFTALTLSAYSSAFYQGFFVPKAMMFCLLIISSYVYLARNKEIVLPKREVFWFFSVLVTLIILQSLFSIAPYSGLLYAGYLSCLFLLYLVVLNLNSTDRNILMLSVVFVGATQAFIGYLQFFDISALLPVHLQIRGSRIAGSVGNPEFLATLLGVSIFIGLHYYDNHYSTLSRRQKLATLALLIFILGAIVLTRNKGTLAFMSFFLIWRLTRRMTLTLAVSSMGALAVLYYFPVSILGRLSLWLTSLFMIKSNSLAGVGPRQFINHYLETVYSLFESYPQLSELLGSYTAMVLDAHNIFLNSWAELGLVGLLLAIVLVVHALRLCKAEKGYLAIALLFLLYKSLYTVMLNSLTGALLFVVLIAVLTPVDSLKNYKISIRVKAFGMPLVLAICTLTTGFALSDYHYQKGLTYLLLSNQEQARMHFNEAKQLNPEDSNYHLALANVNFQKNELELMEENINQAIYYQKSMDSYKISAHMFFYRKKYDKAHDIYDYLSHVFPEHLTTMGKLAQIYLQRQEYDKAAHISEKLLATKPRVKNQSDERNYRIAIKVLEKVSLERSNQPWERTNETL